MLGERLLMKNIEVKVIYLINETLYFVEYTIVFPKLERRELSVTWLFILYTEPLTVCVFACDTDRQRPLHSLLVCPKISSYSRTAYIIHKLLQIPSTVPLSQYKISMFLFFPLLLSLFHTHIIRFSLYEYPGSIPLAFKLSVLETREAIIANAYYNFTQHKNASGSALTLKRICS